MLKTIEDAESPALLAYHLGEGRVLKTRLSLAVRFSSAYHLGEGRVLKTTSFL